MSNNAYLITDAGICLFTNGEQFTVPTDHPNFDKIKKLVSAGNYSKVKPLIDVRDTVSKWLSAEKDFKLENDNISLNGEAFDQAVVGKVLSMMNAGHNAEPLFKFLRKVRSNPSRVAQSELLLFCVANGFMIHEDGDILAYKGVRSDFKDIHSGKFDNSIGEVLEMGRHQVDDRREQTCSYGFHFAAYEYASTWSGSIGHVMIMKINPRDVVSIPSDYNNQKARCCRYEVIAELPKKDTPLEKREVYDDVSAGVPGAKSKNAVEIARKQAVLDGWEKDLERRRRRGLSRSDVWTLEDAIDQIKSEIDDLSSAPSNGSLWGDDDEDDDYENECQCADCQGYGEDDTF